MPGPAPKRESELARPRHRKGGEVKPITKGELKPVTRLNAKSSWTRQAKQIWKAAHESGQYDYYQSSDEAMLWLLCDSVSEWSLAVATPILDDNGEIIGYHPAKRNSQLFGAFVSLSQHLGLTEHSRRAMRIELESAEENAREANVQRLQEAQRARLKGAAPKEE